MRTFLGFFVLFLVGVTLGVLPFLCSRCMEGGDPVLAALLHGWAPITGISGLCTIAAFVVSIAVSYFRADPLKALLAADGCSFLVLCLSLSILVVAQLAVLILSNQFEALLLGAFLVLALVWWLIVLVRGLVRLVRVLRLPATSAEGEFRDGAGI